MSDYINLSDKCHVLQRKDGKLFIARFTLGELNSVLLNEEETQELTKLLSTTK